VIQLSARSLTRQFDRDPVFRSVTFDVRRGERIGLVGPNGCGKTTLMQILAGRDDADSGQVERPSSVRIALLEQQPEFAPGHSLVAEVRSGLAHLYALQHEADELGHRLAEPHDETESARLHLRFDEVHQELDRLDAYHIEHRVEEVLQGLGFEEADYERELSTFSGGQQNRAILGRMLLTAPDVMLLDEPTNHLDIKSTEWLEDFLAKSPQSMIVVSHDRYFLDRVTNRTLELKPDGVDDYPGNFSTYRRLREERQVLLAKTQRKQDEFIAKTEDFIRRNLSGQKSKQAKDREKKLERVERVELLHENSEFPMAFPCSLRAGDWVIRAEGVSKGFGGPMLFKDLSLQVDRGERLGIFGPNGSGKTTLLKILVGEIEPDSGKVRLGTNVQPGYFDQQLASVDPDLDAIEAVRPPNALDFTVGHMRSLLARFGIQGELALQKVGNMSGGERTKVALARLSALKANLLILDEPTNHLDIWARSALERALVEYEGTIVFISHDRYFLDRVASRVLVLSPDRWDVYDGNYSDYLAFIRANRSAGGATRTHRAADRSAGAESEPPRKRRKFPFRPVEEIEADIAACELRIGELHAELGSPDVLRDGRKVKAVQEAYEDSCQRLNELMEHWEEAMERN
jgi:ATP-binding cassette subfamily F protein 3